MYTLEEEMKEIQRQYSLLKANVHFSKHTVYRIPGLLLKSCCNDQQNSLRMAKENLCLLIKISISAVVEDNVHVFSEHWGSIITLSFFGVPEV